jgi:hypothetical protein
VRARQGRYAAHVEGTAGKFGNDLGIDYQRQVDNSDEREGDEGNDATGCHISLLFFRGCIQYRGVGLVTSSR